MVSSCARNGRRISSGHPSVPSLVYSSSCRSILPMHQDSRHSLCLTHFGEAWVRKTMHCSIENRFLCLRIVTMEHSIPAASTHDTFWSEIGRCTLADVTCFFFQSALSHNARNHPQSTHDRSTNLNQVNQHHAAHEPSTLDRLDLHHLDYGGSLRRLLRPERRLYSIVAGLSRRIAAVVRRRGISICGSKPG